MKKYVLALVFLLLSGPVYAGEGHAEHEKVAQSVVTMVAHIELKEALKSNATEKLTLTLQDKDGHPVKMDDLEEVHKAKIHLLIVDQSLTDYQHVHPLAGEKPGDYTFSFTPTTAHSYKVWVDVRLKGGAQQLIPVILQGVQPCTAPCVDKKESRQVDVSEMRFSIDYGGESLKAGDMYHPVVTISDVHGQSVSSLEPVMGAYAHIVGFYEDLEGVLHMHPMGEEPASDDARGTSPLQFMLMPEKSGFLKLFVQIKLNGQDVFAPMGLSIGK